MNMVASIPTVIGYGILIGISNNVYGFVKMLVGSASPSRLARLPQHDSQLGPLYQSEPNPMYASIKR
jgi:hypothetical protein